MRLDELQLIQLFRQPGGMEFVRFCNEVIRDTCWARGVPQSEVSTTLRNDFKDGGVDTRVGRGIPNDTFGYFRLTSRRKWTNRTLGDALRTAMPIGCVYATISQMRKRSRFGTRLMTVCGRSIPQLRLGWC
jgi:hypothetical protein